MAGSSWTNQVQNQVIIAGTSGQLLVYSGTPAAGNLIGSISAAGGTDPFGNAYLAGESNYFHSVSFLALQIFAGTVKWYTASSAAGPWVGASQITQNVAGTVLTITAPALAVPGPVTGGLVASNPLLLTTPETWHPMSPLLNSWAGVAGQVANQYRIVASPPNTVEIIGAVNAAAATAGTFFTLPAAYQPASAQRFAAEGGVAGSAGNGIACDTSGNLTVGGAPGLPSATSWFYHGFISLDA